MTTEKGKFKDGETIEKEVTKVGETIKGFDIIKIDNPTKMGITKMVIIEMKGIDKVGIWSVFTTERTLEEWLLLWNNIHPLSQHL